jgi:hypothetical protein
MGITFSIVDSVCQFYQFRCKFSSGIGRDFNGVPIAFITRNNMNSFLFNPHLNLATFKFEYIVHPGYPISMFNYGHLLLGYVCHH